MTISEAVTINLIINGIEFNGYDGVPISEADSMYASNMLVSQMAPDTAGNLR